MGTSLEEMGPGTSAWTRTCVRPPTRGRKARVKSSTPMPPIQEAKERQNRMPRGRASMSARTVPPEVVKPETISKRQSENPWNSPENQKGKAPKKLKASQMRPTTVKPSREKKASRDGMRARAKPMRATGTMV